MPPIPAKYPVNSPIASAEAAVIAIKTGFRSAAATARQTPARADTGRNIRADPMKARNQMLAYPTVPTLSEPLVQSTRPVAMKTMLISSGVTLVRNF